MHGYVDSDDLWTVVVSRRDRDGGGSWGTPKDRSINGCVGMG